MLKIKLGHDIHWVEDGGVLLKYDLTTRVTKNTDKAVQITTGGRVKLEDGEWKKRCNWGFWLPKSQAKIENGYIEVPEWLVKKKNMMVCLIADSDAQQEAIESGYEE